MRNYQEGSFRTQYTNPSPRLITEFFKPSLTQQHFKSECDINNIMARYRETGFLTDPLKPATTKPQFGDYSTQFDYMAAQNTIAQARESFEALPSRIRKRFANDPAEMLAFLQDESNVEEAVKLGLIEKPAVVDEAVEPSTVTAGGGVAE